MVLARNTISGQISDVSPKMLKHPKFKDILEVVEEDAKPYVPEMYMPGTKQEKAANKPKKKKVEFEELSVFDDELVADDELTLENEEEI